MEHESWILKNDWCLLPPVLKLSDVFKHLKLRQNHGTRPRQGYSRQPEESSGLLGDLGSSTGRLSQGRRPGEPYHDSWDGLLSSHLSQVLSTLPFSYQSNGEFAGGDLARKEFEGLFAWLAVVSQRYGGTV